MNDPKQTMIFPVSTGDSFLESPDSYDGFAVAEERPEANMGMGLANLGFITAALRRKVRFWCSAALVGLLVGCGLFVKFPAPYGATTSILLTNIPTEGPADAMATDVALAQSPTVAARVIQDLRLPSTVTGFLASYTVTGVTDQVLTITVRAASSSSAVVRANALAAEFLRFRTSMLLAQQQYVIKAQEQQISQTQQNLNSLNRQISSIDSQTSAQPASSALADKLRSLRAERNRVSGVLTALEAAESTNQASVQSTTATVIAGSQVINAGTPLPHSHLKYAIEYAVGGLVFGLALGMGIIAVQALASGRLRRRDDVADALGAPVRLSVGTMRVRHWLRPGRAGSRNPNMEYVVGHLLSSMPTNPRGPAALAVVAVDNEQVAAGAVVSLAVSYASQGKQVVVADLSSGTRVGHHLGTGKSGVHEINVKGAHLVVVIPDSEDIAPVGPLHANMSLARHESASEALIDAYSSADLLVTLITLDPAFGGDHLATWATDAVAIVTAGRSSAVRIHAIGEMIRLAGTMLGSAVLIEADKRDESLGMAYAGDQPR